MNLRLLAVVSVWGSLWALGTAETSVGWADKSPREVRHHTICLLEADPRSHFTRVPPPEEYQLQTSLSNAAAITVTYTGFTPLAQAAFQHAVDIWQTQITSAVPIRVSAHFGPMSGSVLGSAGATYVFRDFPGAPVAATWYAKALANKLAGQDQMPNEVDISASFNSNFTWYYGLDGYPPVGQYDFVSVVLHELAHGLGFFGTASMPDATGTWGWSGFPAIYDRFVENGLGQAILNTSLFPNPSTQLGAQLTGNSLYWNGSNGRNGAGGTRPRIYAPSLWRQGSSYSHLDEATYPPGNANSLMTHALGAAEAIHDPGPITRGIFADQGWGSAETPCIGVTLSPAVTSVSTNTLINWAAQASGCTAPEYLFLLYSENAGTWSVLRNWGTAGTFAWSPTEPGRFAVQVWARRAGSTVAYEAWAWSGYFSVAGASTVCTAVMLNANETFPVTAGTPITWNAQAIGCSSPEYYFWLFSAATNSWTELRAWDGAGSVAWTPNESGTYTVQVWVRNTGSTAGYEAWAWSGYFSILSATSPCTAVTLQANRVFPISAGTTVTWTASASGCTSPRYQFLLYSSTTGSWSTLQGWGPTNSVSWTPAQSGTYVVQVWIRREGSSATYEAWAWSGYLVVGP